MKKCSKCGIEKDDSMFSKTRFSIDGLKWACKDCDRKYMVSYMRKRRANKKRSNSMKNSWVEKKHTKRSPVGNTFFVYISGRPYEAKIIRDVRTIEIKNEGDLWT